MQPAEQLRIDTPEQIALELQVAGIGSRFLATELSAGLPDPHTQTLFDSLVKERSGQVRLSELVGAYYAELTERTFQSRSDEDNLLLSDLAAMLSHQFESVASIRRVVRHWDPVFVAAEEFRVFAKSFCRFSDSEAGRLFDRIRADHGGVLTEAGVLVLFRARETPREDQPEAPSGRLLDGLAGRESRDAEAVAESLSSTRALPPPRADPCLSPLDRSSFVLLQLRSAALAHCQRHKLTLRQLFLEFSDRNLMTADQLAELLSALSRPAGFSRADSAPLFAAFRNSFSKHLTFRTFLRMVAVAGRVDPVKTRLVFAHGRHRLGQLTADLKARLAGLL